MKLRDVFTAISLGLSLAVLAAWTTVARNQTHLLLSKASRLETKIGNIESKLFDRCEPNLENEKRCTRIQYLYKNGHFRGVKCLRWED